MDDLPEADEYWLELRGANSSATVYQRIGKRTPSSAGWR